MLNVRGQAFAGYRLLIGAIVALLILMIIVGAVNYLDGLREHVSLQRLHTGIKGAVKQPNQDVLIVEDIIITQSSHSQESLGRIGGIDKDCVDIDAIESDSFELGSSTITINKQILVSVYIQCFTNTSGNCSSSCEVCCTISFGKEIQP